MPPTIRNEKYIQAFGKHLRAIRQKKNLSMQSLGLKSGMDLNSIYRIEKGKVNITVCTLLALANALELSQVELLNFKFSQKS